MSTQEEQNTDELFEQLHFVADPRQSPIRIDKFILSRVEKLSRNKIQNAIKAGSVTVNGKEVKPNFKIKPGFKIEIVLPKPSAEKGHIKPEEIPLEIIYEDESVLVLNKQAGLVVHPGIGNPSGTLVNGLAYYFREKALPIMDGNEMDRPGLVHRIDKDTSGLLVIAKNDYAMTFLANQFFNHSIKRKYLALIWGEPKEKDGTIEGHIGRHPTNRTAQYVYEDGDQGKHAITHYRTVQQFYYVTLVECQLETGRTHQIRAHMKHLGHPLFSDAKYGGDKIIKGTVYTKYKQFVQNCFKILPYQALHAASLAFVHPETKEEMFFEAPLPENFNSLVDKWAKYVETKAG